MLKVSVIVPVYNTEQYLPKCLDSLLEQTLKDIEIICVNDCSTDHSLSVLKEYAQKDSRLRIIDLKDHKGVSVARNKALQVAKGEYVGFIDSDDDIDLDFYEKLYRKALQTNADIVKGDLKECFPNGKIITYPQNENIIKYKNKLLFYISFTSGIYRLSLIKQKNCFFKPGMVHTEDLVWLNRIVRTANAVEVVPDIYYYYRRRSDSTDTDILSEENAKSAYVGYKNLFLNTVAFAKASPLDFSFLYQFYCNAVLSLIFRTPDLTTKALFCKLLFFFYHQLTDFYASYFAKNYQSFLPYFKQNDFSGFIAFIQNKHSFADLLISSLRYNLKQNQNALKLSIVIPVYNVQNYIGKCLDSLCHQTYKNLEIICVDDCSTDNSFHLLKEFAKKDERIRIIQHDQNGGQAAARQTGIDTASGDYIGFVDSDDWLDADYYEKMIERALKDQVDIIINKNILVHEGEKVYDKNFPGHNALEQKVYDHPYELIEKFYCVVWNKIFRTDFLKQRKYTIPVRNAHEDLFFHYVTFAFARNISFFEGAAYHYLLRDESISNLKHDWGEEHIKVYSQIYDFYHQNNLLDKKIKLYSTMPCFIIKNKEMFQEYQQYFKKVATYFQDNKEIFNPLDWFFFNSVCECQDYVEYISKYTGTPIADFLRRKK